MKRLSTLVLGIILLAIATPGAAQSNRESPLMVDGAETIDLDQAVALHQQGVVFIDVRSPRQFNRRHIPGARHLYLNEGFSEANLLRFLDSRDTPVVIYCNGTHCGLSAKAAGIAVNWGFTQIKYFRAGIRAWRLAGNPLAYGAQR